MNLKWLCVPVAACVLTQVGRAGNIFVTSTDSSNSSFTTYNTEPFSFGSSVGSVAGAFAVLPSPNSQKYYLVSRSASDTVDVLEGRFPAVTITKRIPAGGEAVAADLTPDGTRLVVAGPNGVSIINTSTDNAIVTMGIIDAGANPVDVATSIDSTRAYVISNTSARITAINLGNNTVAGSAALSSTAAAVSTGPNGILYVSAQNAIYELDPYTLATRAVINVNGTPDALQFTPDGAYAIARNSSSLAGRGALLIDLAKRTVSDSSNVGGSFTRVVLVNNRAAYAVTATGLLYVMNIGSDGTLTQSAVTLSDVTNVLDIASSGEIPRSQYLILLTGSALYRLDTLSSQVAGPVSSANVRGSLTVINPVSTGTVTGVIAANASQTVASGSSSLPLVVQTYGSNGLPVSGAAVQFTSATSGVTFTSSTATTGLSGFASTRVNIPSSITTGSVSVTASVGGRTATYTLTIGNPQLPGGGSGTTVQTGLIITAGQGEAISEFFSTSFQEPLQVRLLDANGNPVYNATINWALVQGSGSVSPQQSNTDSNGYATANFTASGIAPGLPFLTNTISATAPSGQTASFYVTGLRRLRDSPGSISPQLVAPADKAINAKAGDVIPGAIQFKVTSTSDGTPIPYIGMRVISSTDASAGPTADCRGGIVFSDQTGTISCDLVIGPRLGGYGSFQVLVGSVARYDFTLTVVSGGASDVRAIQGGTQSGNPGQTLSPVVVQVYDSGGNVLPNVAVSWDVPSVVGVVSLQQQTDFNGQVRGTFSLPTTPGVYTVRARAGTGTATITLTANAVAGSLSVASGNLQTAIVGQAFAAPVKVTVLDAQSRPLAGAPVTFSVTSGSASLSPTTAQSGADGTASATVTAGSASGPIEVTATSGSASVKFTLTARLQGPSFTAASFLSAGGFQPGVSPGSLAFIKAAGIAPNLRGSVTPSSVVGPLPTKLNDVEVLFNDILAPIYAVSNVNGEESVIVQVPFEVPSGTASVTIRTTGGGTTTVSGVTIYAVKPGIFTYSDGTATYAVATRQDGSYVSSSNPVRRGDTIRLFVTGLGATTGGLGTNQGGVPNQTVAAPVIAGVGPVGIRVVSAESQQGSVGVYIVTVEVPLDLDLTQAGSGTAKAIGLAVAGPDGNFVYANYVTLPVI